MRERASRPGRAGARARAIGRAVRRFAAERRGTSGIEFALIAPILLLLLLGGTTVFTLVRDSRTAERATYTVSDLLSRSTTKPDLKASHALFLAITRHAAADVRFRVTSVKKVKDKMVIDWSRAQAPQAPLADLAPLSAKLPVVADGDSILLVETSLTSRPLFSYLGLTNQTFAYLSANRPRFVPALPAPD